MYKKYLVDFLIKGAIEANAHITTGGTSSDFVKGDGSLDGNSYALDSNVLHKTGDYALYYKGGINTGTDLDTLEEGYYLIATSIDRTTLNGFPTNYITSNGRMVVEVWNTGAYILQRITQKTATDNQIIVQRISDSGGGFSDWSKIYTDIDFLTDNLIIGDNSRKSKNIESIALDDLLESGVGFRPNPSDPSLPFGVHSQILHSQHPSTDLYAFELSSNYNGVADNLGYRRKNNGVWGDWNRVWHSGLFDINDYLTESESDGRYLLNTTDTFIGDLDIIGNVLQDNGNYIFRSDGNNYFAITRNGTVDGSSPFVDFLNGSTFNLIRSTGDLVIRAGDVGNGVPSNERFRFKTNGEFQATGGNSTQWNKSIKGYDDIKDVDVIGGIDLNQGFSSIFYVSTSSTNRPPVGNSHIISQSILGGDYTQQIGGRNNQLYFRHIENGVDLGWNRFWTDFDFSQTDVNNWNNYNLQSITNNGNTTSNNIIIESTSSLNEGFIKKIPFDSSTGGWRRRVLAIFGGDSDIDAGGIYLRGEGDTVLFPSISGKYDDDGFSWNPVNAFKIGYDSNYTFPKGNATLDVENGVYHNGELLSTQNWVLSNFLENANNAWILDREGSQRMYFGDSSNISNGIILRQSNNTASFQIRDNSNTQIFTVDSGGSLTIGSIPWARITGAPSFATPTLQEVITAGNTLTGSNLIDIGTFLDFRGTDSGGVRTSVLISEGDYAQLYYDDAGSRNRVEVSNNGVVLSADDKKIRLKTQQSTSFESQIDTNLLSQSRNHSMPDDDGVIALTKDQVYYEEGDWTPWIEGTGSGSTKVYGTGGGLSSGDCKYIRIGNQVTIYFDIIFSSLSSLSGTLLFYNLPYQPLIDSSCTPAHSFNINYESGRTTLVLNAISGTNYMRFYSIGSQQPLSTLGFNQISNISLLQGSLTYMIDE